MFTLQSWILQIKAFQFALGVDESSALPRGHEHAGFEGPLLWLMSQRWQSLGKRLQGVTKDELDDKSDYFLIKDNPVRCLMTVSPDLTGGEAIINTGHKLAGEGWYIKDPETYSKACICHDAEGIEQNLSKRAEKDYAAPIFAEEFHFPDVAGNGKKLDFVKAAATSSDVDDLIKRLHASQGSSTGAASANQVKASGTGKTSAPGTPT